MNVLAVKLGSVCAFKSGGKPMTVTNIDTEGKTLDDVKIATVWMDDTGGVQRWAGPLACVDVRRERDVEASPPGCERGR